MEAATFVGDLEGLTPLIIFVLGFSALLIFHKQIKMLVERATKIDVKRGKTRVQADLSAPSGRSDLDEEEGAPSGSGSGDAEEEKKSAETEAIAASDSEDELTDLDAIRAKMMDAYWAGDSAIGDAKFAELLAHETDDAERKRDRVRKVATQIVGGIASDGFQELKEMSSDPEISSFCHRMEGIALNAVEKPAEAAEAYAESVRFARSPDSKATAQTLRANTLTRLGRSEEAEAELVEALRNTDDDDLAAKYWAGLAELYAQVEDEELRALALHNVAKIEGNNARAWFQAGYAYSHVSSGDHFIIPVIHCYLNALYFDRGQVWAMNNLGVVLDEAELPLLSVDRYRQAEKRGNTLASANLAHKLKRAGFREEAEGLLKKAAESESPHENVASTKAALDADRKEQKEKFDEMRGAGTRAGEFLTTYARRRLDDRLDITGSWAVKTYEVLVQHQDEEVEISWDEGGYHGKRRFKGKISGATVSGRFYNEGASWRTGEVSWERDADGYGFLDPAGSEFRFLKLKKDGTEYVELKKTVPDETA